MTRLKFSPTSKRPANTNKYKLCVSRRPCNYNLIFHPIVTRMSPSHHSSDSLPPPPPSLPSRPIVPMPPFRFGSDVTSPSKEVRCHTTSMESDSQSLPIPSSYHSHASSIAARSGTLAQPIRPNYYIPKVPTLLPSFPVVTAVPVSYGSGYD
jgi:hypothetical protein